jgi:lysophospholipase L1-like esterase
MNLSWRAVLLVGSSAPVVLAGCGNPTSPGPTIAAPTSLTATELPSGDLDLTWQDNSTDEVGFELQRSTTGASGTYVTIATLVPNVADFVDDQVDGVTQYCYRVRAVGASGTTPSAYTTPACHQSAPPAAPTDLTATVSEATAISLAWTDHASDEQGFEVWRSTSGATGVFAPVDTVGVNVTGADDSGLTPGTNYCYQVRALGVGTSPPSDFSNTQCATTPAALAAPSAPQAAATTPSRISVTWQDNSSDEAGFEVWRSSSGIGGTYTLRSTLDVDVESFSDTGLNSATEYCYQVRATGSGRGVPGSPFTGPVCATTPLLVRVVLFGDSNTDFCADHQTSSDPLRFNSYVSVKPALSPTAQHLSCSVAFKVHSAWGAMRPESVLVVNHGIGGTTTGGLGGTGDAARTAKSAPNARASVGGTTRYQAEVLGVQAPDWSGGETNTTWFPNGPVTRVNAYVPKTNDFVYVSMGTNDDSGPTRTLSSSATAANLQWMIQGWINAGHPANHFILTTLAPRTDGTLNSATAIPDRNDRISNLASTFGVHLIDLAAHVSEDNGLTWKNSSFQIGDGVHYSEDVRAWLGGQITSWMSAQAPPVP